LEGKVLKNNKYAGFEFLTEERFEAGIVLDGLDVKEIRKGAFNIRDSSVILQNNELFLINLVFESAKNTKVKRKLLLKREEIDKVSKLLQNKRYHGYVLNVRYNEKNLIKFDIGIGTIKRKFEKKASQKRASEKRNIERQIQKGII